MVRVRKGDLATHGPVAVRRDNLSALTLRRYISPWRDIREQSVMKPYLNAW